MITMLLLNILFFNCYLVAMKGLSEIMDKENELNVFAIYQLKQDEITRNFRFEGMEYLEKNGIYVSKDNYNLVYVGRLEDKMTLDDIYTIFNIDHPADFKGHSLSISDVIVTSKNNIVSSYYVDRFGFKELPYFVDNIEQISIDQNNMQNDIPEPEPEELAFSLDDKNFISIQTCDDGYDYSIYDSDYKLIDGGVYDDPDISIHSVLNILVEEYCPGTKIIEPVDFYELNKFVEAVERSLEKAAIVGEKYVKTNMGDIPLEDYYEIKAHEYGYDSYADMKAEGLGISEPETFVKSSNIVNEFKAKTREMFNNIDGKSADDITRIVTSYIKERIEEFELDAAVIDVVVSGSRCRGLERNDSDIDIVFEYSGTEREDHLFNLMHEESLAIDGKVIDINPITAAETGTLGEYLPGVEKYLDNKAKENKIETNNRAKRKGR